MEAVRNIRQVVLHMLVRWELRPYLVVKERIAMARQESEIVLEIMSVVGNDSRWRYMVGSPRERESLRPTIHPFI